MGIAEARKECLARQAVPEPDRETAPKRAVPLLRVFIEGEWKEAHFDRYKPSTRKGVHYLLSSRILPEFGSKKLDRMTGAQLSRRFDAFSRTAPGNPVPQCEIIAVRPIRIARRRKHEGTCVSRLPFKDAPGLAVEGNLSRARLAVCEEERVAMDLGPAKAQDLTLAASDEQKKANDIRLLPIVLSGLCVQNPVQTADLLTRQEAGKPGPAVGPDTLGRVPLDVAASHREVHDLPKQRQGMIGVRRKAGIEDVRLHDLRHTHASHAVTNGVPVPVVSRMLGHSNVRMTLRYAHLGDREIEAAAERIGRSVAATMDM